MEIPLLGNNHRLVRLFIIKSSSVASPLNSPLASNDV